MANEHQCTVCEATFESNDELEMHLSSHHNENLESHHLSESVKSHTCKKCVNSYETKSDLLNHVCTPFLCSFCDKAFTQNSFLLSHIRTHTGVVLCQCDICKKYFSSNKKLLLHIKTHHRDKPIKGGECGLIFTANDKLQCHMSNHRGEEQEMVTKRVRKDIGEENYYYCNVCKKVFTTNDSLLVHLKTHSRENTYNCSQCNICFSKKSCLERHLRSHSDKIIQSFESQSYESDDKSPLEYPIVPNQINNTTSNSNSILFEMAYTAACLTENVKPNSFKRVMDQYFSLNNSPINDPSPYNKHTVNFVTNDNFSLNTDTQFLERVTHNTENSHLANYDVTSLPEHENVNFSDTLSGKHPYQCNHCGKAFTGKFKLAEHQRTHTGEKPYNCNICGKSFTTQRYIKVHMKIHNGEEVDKPYKCSQCDLAFRQNSHLVIHMRKHTGEKPFDCEHCEKEFPSNALLLRHLKTHMK